MRNYRLNLIPLLMAMAALIVIQALPCYATNKWGVGKAETDNGVMILIALDDHAWRVQVGLGLESILTTERLTDIMEETAVPEFSQNNYAQGLIDAAEEIGSVLESEFNADE